jgi:hypothetical protein
MMKMRLFHTLRFACLGVAFTSLSSMTIQLADAGPINLVCDEFPPEQREEISEIIKQVEKTCSEVFGVDVSSIDDDALLELHMNYNDYKRMDREMNDGEFRTNWAFVRASEMQGHVALQPPLEYDVLVETGLPLQTKIMVADVAVYLCTYRAFNNSASHPDWLREGLSGYLGSQALRELGIMGELESEPWTSEEIHTIRRLFKDKPKYDVMSILDGEDKDISRGRLASARSAFIGWLMDIGVFDEMINQASRLGGGSSYEQSLKQATLNAIKTAGVDSPESAFRSWVDAFEPEWREEYRSLTTHGDVWLHTAWNRRNAVCWNKETLGDEDWELTGSVKIYDRESSQLNILLGRTDAGFMSVALGPTFGVTVFHRKFAQDKEKAKWIRLKNQELRTLEMGEWVDFKISKRRDRLFVKVNSERTLRVDVSNIDLDGNWGLGCQVKSAGEWKDVKVER